MTRHTWPGKNENGETIRLRECRFDFGTQSVASAQTSGKPARRNPALRTDNRNITKLEPARDMPMLNARNRVAAHCQPTRRRVVYAT